jgi:hypothetical protein
MTLQELKNEIDALLLANDYDGIVDLLTIENVVLVSNCTLKPLGNTFQSPNDANWLLDEYNLLYAFIAGAGSANQVLTVFTEQYLLIAEFGRQSREIVSLATEEFTDQGFPSPGALAETRTEEYFEDLMIFLNENRNDLCL